MPGAIIPYRSAPQPPSPPGVRGRWFASAGGLPAAGHLVTHQYHCWWYHIPILLQNLKRPQEQQYDVATNTAGDTTYQFCSKTLSDLREQQNDVATNFPKMPDGKKKEHIFNSSHPLPAIKFQHDLAQFVAKSTSSVPFCKFWGSYSCLLKSKCHTLSSAIARPFKFGASWESRPSRSRSRSPTWSSCETRWTRWAAR